jgi:hypothetical protein
MATETSDALPPRSAAGEETRRLREQLKEAADRTAALEAQVLGLERERKACQQNCDELGCVPCHLVFHAVFTYSINAERRWSTYPGVFNGTRRRRSRQRRTRRAGRLASRGISRLSTTATGTSSP